MHYKDQLNRKLFLPNTPKRIVSLVPSQTELLCDLGLTNSIVGVTKFCVHPQDIKDEAEVVGGTKQVHYDKIEALKPDIILCNKEENTLEMIQELVKIAPVHLSDIYTLQDCFELINMYGDIFRVQSKAETLIKNIIEEQQQFKEYILNEKELTVAYFIWKTPWMVAAKQTFIHYLLEVNKFKNVFSGLDRYPEINLENLKSEELDVILLSSEPYPFKEEHKNALQEQFPKAKVLIVDGEMFSWYGSRLIQAFSYFKLLRQNYLN